MPGDPSDYREEASRLPPVIREIADRLVIGKLGSLLVAALAILVALQAAGVVVLSGHGPRRLYLPDCGLIRPQEVR